MASRILSTARLDTRLYLYYQGCQVIWKSKQLFTVKINVM